MSPHKVAVQSKQVNSQKTIEHLAHSKRVGHFLSFFFSFFSFPKDNYNIGGVLRYMNKAIKRSETHFTMTRNFSFNSKGCWCC